jgi:hypothetical protein
MVLTLETLDLFQEGLMLGRESVIRIAHNGVCPHWEFCDWIKENCLRLTHSFVQRVIYHYNSVSPAAGDIIIPDF